MTITRNYLQLQQQIADELGDRQDLMQALLDSNLTTSPIQNAIQSAIAKWEREPFWFTELYDQGAFNTTAAQEFYTVADVPLFASLEKIDKVRVLINSNRYTLTARTWQYIEDISVNPAAQSEFPVDFAYYANAMRFYPIPDEAIPVTIMGNARVGELALPSDVNAWTTEAFDLIRSEAKLILAMEVLYDDDLASRMKTAIYGDVQTPFARQLTNGYLYALKAESTRRGAGGRIRPTYF